MEKHRWSNEEIKAFRKEKGQAFYYNKDDTNFMVPKGYGYGLTFNWASPFLWVFGAFIIVVILLSLIFR